MWQLIHQKYWWKTEGQLPVLFQRESCIKSANGEELAAILDFAELGPEGGPGEEVDRARALEAYIKVLPIFLFLWLCPLSAYFWDSLH